MSASINEIDQLLEKYDKWQEQKDCQQTNELTGEISEIPEKPKFEVTDKSSAEWVMRKIAKLNKDISEIQNIVTEQTEPLRQEIKQIEEWGQNETEKASSHVKFLESFLEPFHRKLIEIDPKAKTIKLPHGKMEIRKQQPKIEKDDKTLLTWLKKGKMDNFIKTEETPKWGELKELTKIEKGKVIYTETGEIVEGVTAIDRPDKFEVKTC
ncbi:MAG: host-nuclease inhibitor Gam family protein [Thermincolia bacterium]